MISDDDCLQQYAVCEQIRTASTAVDGEREAAWRQQALLLQHLTENLTPQFRYTLMREHSSKMDWNGFVQQRVQGVEKLLQGKSVSLAETGDGFAELTPDLFDPPCHGVYESCSSSEVCQEHLRALHNGTPRVQNYHAAKPLQPVPTMPRPAVKSNGIVSNTHNSIMSFLQPNKKEESNKMDEQCSQPPPTSTTTCDFRTAREELIVQNIKKYGNANGNGAAPSSVATPLFNYGNVKKTLGTRRTVRSMFVPPVRGEEERKPITSSPPETVEPTDKRLANIDPKMIELITNEIMNKEDPVDWSDIAGLDYAKTIIKEAVVLPMLRPDIFTGMRRPPRGILLFGPPGTGKTLIGKCIASQSKSTFFSISAASLTSKWIGDGEKMVRALFAVAAVRQPAVVFIDEIDSLLMQRSDTEHESSRRLKTEFLVQLDGATTSTDDRILVVGATNRPQELDDAARRRLVKRLYIPLPELSARIQILTNLLQKVRSDLSADELQEIGQLTAGYSGADMESLCREASMAPIRALPVEQLLQMDAETLRCVHADDFRCALQNVRPSVSPDDLEQYIAWNRIYGAKP